MVCDDLDVDLVGIIVLDIAERLLHICDLFLLGRDVFPGGFACQKIQIFIQYAVHHQITVLRQIVRLEHLLVAEPDAVVFSVVEIRSLQKGSPLQIFFDLDPLKSDPGVSPGMIFIRFVVDQCVGADQEGVALRELVDVPVCFVDPFSF